MTERAEITHSQLATVEGQRRLLNAMYTEIAQARALANSVKTQLNAIINYLKGDFLLTGPALAIGSTAQNVSNVAFSYVINGALYYKAAVAAGTPPGNDVVPQNKYGAVAFDIGTDGTIDAVEAAANATGYNSAALAVAGIPAVAADHVRIGNVTVVKSDGTFTFGTTALSDANTTEVYTSTSTLFSGIATAVSEASMTQQVNPGK